MCSSPQARIEVSGCNQRGVLTIKAAAGSQCRVKYKRSQLSMPIVRDTTSKLQLLSELLFGAGSSRMETGSDRVSQGTASNSAADLVATLTIQDLEELKSLAMTNHVIMRCFERLAPILKFAGKPELSAWAFVALEDERKRIRHALGILNQICDAFESAGCPIMVIKSLDHWPDLGSDLDLYSDADASQVVDVMRAKFDAKVEDRSWGDRLANKWNFVIPGLPELVEVHVGRLGQTGEQTVVTRSVSSRRRMAYVEGYSFPIPAPEDRIVISTLQRMYRHFYIRLC